MSGIKKLTPDDASDHGQLGNPAMGGARYLGENRKAVATPAGKTTSVAESDIAPARKAVAAAIESGDEEQILAAAARKLPTIIN